MLNSKIKHRNFLQETNKIKTNKKQTNKQKKNSVQSKHAYKHVHTVLLVKSPSHRIAFSFYSKTFMIEIIIIVMMITTIIIIIIIIDRVNVNDNSDKV